MTRLVIVGGGRMGEALLSGLLAGGWADAGEIVVVEVSPTRREELAAAHPGVRVTDTPEPADGAVVAVKPPDAAEACAVLAALGVPRVLSLAAGVTLATLDAAAGSGTVVIRSMPNTPALVGQGAAAISGGAGASPDDLDWAEAILAAVGIVVRVPEMQLDAVTGLSGSGPAYAFLVAESLVDAGVMAGLPRATAEALTVQTLLGAAVMLRDSGSHPAELRNAVTSPGGTTAAGLRVLEQAGVRAALLDAVLAATERSVELGRSAG